jgi:hypothetical protein
MRTARFVGHLAIAAAAAAAAIAPAGCMQQKLESKWLDRTITIDGKAPEWAGQEAYFDEGHGLKVGFFNDARYLYVYLSTWHRRTEMQALAAGLTVWIDASGGTKRTFGVKYPIGGAMPRETGELAPSGEEELAASEGGERFPRPGAAGSGSGALERLLESARGEIDIVGAGGETVLTIAASDSGASDVEAMVDIANRTLVYELKIPLASAGAAPYAVKARPGSTIGIGIETGSMEMRRMRRNGEAPMDRGEFPRSPGGGTEGYPGGGMGGFGGGMGHRGGPSGGPETEGLKLWVKVALAAGPRPAAAK